MPRVVIDASVVVSAGLKPGSHPAISILIARSFGTILMSNAVELEIRAVVARPKFSRYATELTMILESIIALAERIEPDVAVFDVRLPGPER
jgi:predicted nucleic acid-binding protein